ncbi:UDP-2,3-diacylglucosamine diphosphatase [Lacisediminimonas sp.]|uniref:UDP-2,3-diacylglucosamine diphosphatase n=1 Tax=Lacisediminimonas sp. TaxID=3060582 RepID=UPI00271928AE|nr:UDP-2,3-diacylglucosamine diphosphatase [Lacisediminimonas sp.]MDO8298926.1 UDP-2,3-diacylglucosamine diphosphatase [Lacisediminimonas sp.]
MTHSAQATPPLVALFVSDLHLDAALPRTTARFLRLLDETAPAAQALYLLGDIFEYWAGDDDITNDFNRRIVAALRTLGRRGVDLFWIAGNRDFLVGAQFAQQAGLQLLDDPTSLTLAGQRIVLTHGDMLCTDDHAYQAFRAQVREPGWQQQFLSQPLSERKRVIETMRQQSRDAQRVKAPEIMDVNESAVQRLFEQSGAGLMIHGHTHRPGVHRYQGGLVRHVLPDWDLDHGAARGGWLQLDEAGVVTAVSALDG